MRKLLLYLDKLPFYKVLLVLTFVFIVYNVFSSNLIDWLGLDLMENTYFDSYTLEELFGIVVLCAPILETLIFQLLSIELVIFGLTKLNLGSHRGILIIAGIVSAILFGLSHSYSIHYIVLSFVGGLIMLVPILLITKGDYLDGDSYISIYDVVINILLALVIGGLMYPLWSGNIGHKIFGIKVISIENGEDVKNPISGIIRELGKNILQYYKS